MPEGTAPESIGGRVRSMLAKLFGGAIRDDGAPATPDPDARTAHLDTGPAHEAAPAPIGDRLAHTPAPELRDDAPAPASGVGDARLGDTDLDDTVVSMPGDPALPTAAAVPDASWTVVRLRGRARELGVRGYSSMSKAQLLAAISSTEQ